MAYLTMKRTKTPPRRIRDIQWRRRCVIGMGGYSVVYEIAAGVCVKVGRIKENEAEAQRHLARQGFAVPVLDYASGLELAAVLHRECCGRHGVRRGLLAGDNVQCTCGEELDALLMPTTDSDISVWNEETLHAFRMQVDRTCEKELGRIWDYRPANLACYRGHLVALDFGEPSG
jgi:hypothetical protein